MGRAWKFPKGKPVNNCAFCSKSKPALVHTIAIDLGEPSASLFSPKSVFTGTLNWEAETFVSEGDAAKALRFAQIKNPSLKAKASRSHIVESLTFGKLWVLCSINAEMTALMTITLLEAPAKEEKLPPIRPPEGTGVSFEDFNFKLMVIEELMYRREVLKPRFDVYAFAKRFDERQIDIANEGFDVIPEVRRYFDEYPIPAELLLDIESLVQDGSQIHLQVCPLWDGQDDTFNIRSTVDAAMLPNLKNLLVSLAGKKLVLFYDESDAVLKAFKARGIAAKFVS